MATNESFTCKGVKKLVNLLQNGRNKDLSENGKTILKQLLKENNLYNDEETTTRIAPSDGVHDEDDGDDGDDGDDENYENYENNAIRNISKDCHLFQHGWTGHDATKSPSLFSTLLKVVHELEQHKKIESSKTEETTSTAPDTPTTASADDITESNPVSPSLNVPVTNEIIEQILSMKGQNPNTRKDINPTSQADGSNEQAELAPLKDELDSKLSFLSLILPPPSNIPCSLDSNQVILSALLFLSESFLIDNNAPSSQPDTTHFPKMPLFVKHSIWNNSKGKKKLNIKSMPYGFTINQNLVPCMDTLVENRTFWKQLSLFESYFWSISSPNIEHLPRKHVLPRNDMGITISKYDEERILFTGSLVGTAHERKVSISDDGNKKKYCVKLNYKKGNGTKKAAGTKKKATKRKSDTIARDD